MTPKFKVGDKVQIAGNGLEPINCEIMTATVLSDHPIGYYGVRCEGWGTPPGTMSAIPFQVLDRVGTKLN